MKLEKVRIDQKLGPVLTVSGLDLLDHTPLFDIKPYLPYVDAHPEAKKTVLRKNSGSFRYR